MLKSIPLLAACAAVSLAVTYVGRTVYSSPFQIDMPYYSAVKTTLDPANIWSWHHSFSSGGGTTTAEVLVDVDGDNQMDTQVPWVRVLVTDLEVVFPYGTGGEAIAWVCDGTGRRFAVSAGGFQAVGPVGHCALATPIALPVGSPLRVEVSNPGSGPVEVNLIGRVVNL